MPELPEVERERKKAHAALVNHRIVEANAADDRIVYDGVRPKEFARALVGRRVVDTHRKGKYLWLQLDRRPWPVMHFGMGGHFEIYDKPGATPAYWKLEVVTDAGLRLAMTNPRRLGRIRLARDPAAEPPISLLGFDPLLDMPGMKEFTELLARRKAPVKAVLLDQSFAAGVGNWIADEVLYQSRIAPTRLASSLNPEEIGTLRKKLADVIRTAVRVDANKKNFPKNWLFAHRWGRRSESRTSKGEQIVHITIAGRTTAWVPGVQR